MKKKVELVSRSIDHVAGKASMLVEFSVFTHVTIDSFSIEDHLKRQLLEALLHDVAASPIPGVRITIEQNPEQGKTVHFAEIEFQSMDKMRRQLILPKD
jgi:hypothetical protein